MLISSIFFNIVFAYWKRLERIPIPHFINVPFLQKIIFSHIWMLHKEFFVFRNLLFSQSKKGKQEKKQQPRASRKRMQSAKTKKQKTEMKIFRFHDDVEIFDLCSFWGMTCDTSRRKNNYVIYLFLMRKKFR